MARLPLPNQDQGTWGSVLNGFLQVSHNPDGTLIPSSLTTAGSVDTSSTQTITGTKTFSTLTTSTLQVTGGTPATGKVLTSDASGNATWQVSGTAPVTSVAGKVGAVTLAETDITNLTTDLAATEKTANKGTANGYPSLNSSTLIPTTQLATGSASSTTFLRGDNTWATPATGTTTTVSAADTSIIVGGTTSAPTIRTATVDVIATDHPAAADWSNNSHKITNLTNGSAAQDAAAFGQIPTSASTIGGLLTTSNLSELTATASTARTNLGLGTAATQNTTTFLQPGNNLSDVNDTGTSRANIHVPTLTPAAAVSIANLTTLSTTTTTVDGYTLATGDLVLLTAQSTASQNGLWLVPASGNWTRPTEFASGINVKGRTCAVINGTTYSGSSWILKAPTAGITVDTSSQVWSNQGGGGSYVTAPGSTANEQGYVPLVLSPSGTTQWGMPWQFNVIGYGAKGNGNCVVDGAITSGTAILTCSTSTPFTSADVGKAIMVKNALTTATGTTLCTTIASYQSASQVTLSANATVTVSSGTVLYGTDDTTAFQGAVNAAVTYAEAHGQYAEVVIPPSGGYFYPIAGALQTGGSTLGNAQITLPIVGPTAPKVTLVLNGGENSAAARYWDQAYPAFNGPTLLSFGVFASATIQKNNIGANGNPAIIGGPTGTNGYGTSRSPLDPLYSNMMITVKGITLMSPHSVDGLIYSACNFHGIACANLFDMSYGTIAVINLTASQTTPSLDDLSSVSSLAAGLSIGIVMPADANNDSNQVRNIICQGGYTYAFFATEHTDIHGATFLYCWSGLCLVGDYGDGGIGNGALHAVHASQLSVEACSYHVNVIGGPASFNGTLDTEGTIEIIDNGTTTGGTPTKGTFLAGTRGEMRLIGSASTVNLNGSATGTNSTGTLMRIITDWQAPGAVTSPTYTLGTAQFSAFTYGNNPTNSGWRPATVYLSGGSGITSIQVSQYMGGATAPTTFTTIYSQSAGPLPYMNFRLNPGQWWVINPAGATAPSFMQWILD